MLQSARTLRPPSPGGSHEFHCGNAPRAPGLTGRKHESPVVGSAAGGAIVALIILLVPLMAVPVPQGRQAIQSIAVLPLENLSGDPRPGLFLRGHPRSADHGPRPAQRPPAGDRQGLGDARQGDEDAPGRDRPGARRRPAVTGAVVHSGDRVRVTARLVDRDRGAALGQSYESDLRDVLSLQNEIVSAIMGELERAALTRQDRRPAGRRPPRRSRGL